MLRRLFLAFLLLTGVGLMVQAQPGPETKAHTALVHSIAVSPDGKTIATAGFDKVVKLWEYANGALKELKQLPGHTDPVYCVAFSHDGKLLASSSLDKSIRLWTVADGKMVKEMKGHTDIVDTIAFSNGIKLLASGSQLLASGSGMQDKSVRLWNPADAKEIKNLGTHTASVYSVIFSPDGNLLASAGADNIIKIWDVASQKELKQLKGHQMGVTGVVFAGDNNTLVSISQDRTIRVWNIMEGKEIKKFGPTADDLYGLAYHKDSKLLLTAGYASNIAVWDLNDPKPKFAYKAKSPAYCAVFSPDGKFAITGHDNGSVQIKPITLGK